MLGASQGRCALASFASRLSAAVMPVWSFWKKRRWHLRTERVSFTHELYIVRGPQKLFICELHVSPQQARSNILIIEQAMLLVDLLNAQQLKERDILKSLASLYRNKISDVEDSPG